MVWEFLRIILQAFYSFLHGCLIGFAIIQAFVSCYLLICISVLLFYLGNEVDQYIQYVSFVDLFTGLNIAGQIDGVVGFWMAIIMTIVISQFVICVLLCKGLCENKPWMTLQYVVFGVILLGFSVRMIDPKETAKPFTKENPLYQCCCYAGILTGLVVVGVGQILKKNKNRK